MIDSFALALTHGLMLLAAWRLLSRPDLDDDEAPVPAADGDRRWPFDRSRPGA
ncbi:MAG: hypothetical protein ACXWU1_12385 [Allosphingosinicella sp.]